MSELLAALWINGHAWIVTHEKKPVDVFHFIQTAQVSHAQLLVNGLLPRATAPFFSVKLFELGGLATKACAGR
jgi:hypothetical protein